MKYCFLLLFIVLSCVGCGAEHAPYHLILVEKERHFYDIHTLDPCATSGYDLVPKEPKEQAKVNTVELWVTYENCGVKEKIILDDSKKPMWGVPLHEEPKQKGSVGVQ